MFVYSVKPRDYNKENYHFLLSEIIEQSGIHI